MNAKQAVAGVAIGDTTLPASGEVISAESHFALGLGLTNECNLSCAF